MRGSHILSIPLIAQAGDLAGELGQILVGAALVVADDFHQTLAHIDQAVVSSAGAHIGFGAGLDDFCVLPVSAQAARPSLTIQTAPL